MEDKKINIGDIRPLFQQVGFEVCKVTDDNPEKQEWIQVEKLNEAEIISISYKLYNLLNKQGK